MNYTKLILSGNYRETGRQTRGLVSSAGSEGFRFDEFYLKIETILLKKKIRRVLVECRDDFSPQVFAGLEEIRERLKKLADSGKEVWFYSPSYDASRLYLASVCSRKIIHPMGTVRYLGLSWPFSFYKRLIRRLGIDAEIIRRKDYKSAGDSFSTDHLEETNREQYSRFLDNAQRHLSEKIRGGFGKSDDDLKRLSDGEVLQTEAALSGGWVDEIITPGDLERRWKDDDKASEIKLKKGAGGRRGLPFPGKRVAVLVFEGAIIDGHSRRDPVMGQAIGSESFIPHIRKLKKDKRTKAVVFRINSGGGSAFASEDICRELASLAGKKPLIVSMSELAGSGGYWISCCGSKTIASETTLTGSIGVISIYFALHRLMDSLGITHEIIKTGAHADIGSPFRALTDKEKEIIDAEIGAMYDRFIGKVAEFRGLDAGKVDELGGGRIWSGKDAIESGLIDEIGGLAEAVKMAAEQAGVSRPEIRFYPEVRRSLVERLIFSSSKEDEEAADMIHTAAALIQGFTGGLNGSAAAGGPLAFMEEALF